MKFIKTFFVVLLQLVVGFALAISIPLFFSWLFSLIIPSVGGFVGAVFGLLAFVALLITYSTSRYES